MANNKTYAPLPFSYLTGGSAPEKSPSYGVKTSTSQDDVADGPVQSDADPYSIYAGKANQPSHAPIGGRKSMDIADPHIDVADPYLLSTGRLSGDKGGSAPYDTNNITSDPRYRNTVPSESEGDNVFFRPPEGANENTHRPGYTNAALDAGEDDTMTRANKKLPRYRVGTDSTYQYYSGSESNGTNNVPNQDNMLNVPPSGAQQHRAPSPGPNIPKGGMDSANNPIWEKYYAGTPPAAVTAPTTGTGYDSYRPNSPTASPAVRPNTKDDDFNTLIRNSRASNYGKECCGSKRCAVATAVVVTAIICLGAGFAAGWFIFQAVNPESTGTTTTTVAMTTVAVSAGGVVQTTTPPRQPEVMTTRPSPRTTTTTNPAVTTTTQQSSITTQGHTATPS